MVSFSSSAEHWPVLRLARIEASVFRAPIERPVITSFGTMHDRPALLLRVEDAEGAHGWGEVWVNFPGCGAEHRARLIDTVLAPLALDRPFRHPAELFAGLTAQLRLLALQAGEPGPLAQVAAGLDIAVWDLVARRLGRPLRSLLRPDAAAAVPAYASGIHPREFAERVTSARADGFEAFKMKVGFDAEQDVDAVARLAASRRPGETMMLDANQAWDLPTATRMAQRLEAYGIGWLEEPMPVDRPWSEWRSLATRTSIALAGGENLRGAEAFHAAIDSGALAVLQPDMCKWGGFSGCYPVARTVIDAGHRYCPHFLGAGVGLAASAHLLAAVGGEGLLEVDVNPNPLRSALVQSAARLEGGCFVLGDAAGLGVEPDAAAGAAWRVLHTVRDVAGSSA